MASFNKVMLIGNLTRDPEVKFTPSGMAVADIRLAVNRRYRSADNQEHEETCFVNVTVWGKQAESCGQYLKRGRPVFIEGRLKYDEWEKDGQKFNRLSVVAERVQFLGDGTGAGRSGSSAQDGSMSSGGGSGAAPVTAAAPAAARGAAAGTVAEADDEMGADDRADDERDPLAGDADNLPF
ncbi:MAG TPA: single-stranded DNA-binding protein [Verrucomicrobia bacterium]|nr:single-stranded DNA-binding protein [Verrucomicrobiota bacterium]